jgi:glycosyltransferase involved in cell wall biosynthesis
MTLGMPVVALATAEIPSVIENGVNGFASNDIDQLERNMQRLLDDPQLAREIGARGRETALRRFGIQRFIGDWDTTFRDAIGQHQASRTALQAAPSMGRTS